MKIYNVCITDHALNDMQDIYDYILDTLFSPEAAMSQYNRIADSIESLSEYPERHRLFLSEPERTQGIRLFPIDRLRGYLYCFAGYGYGIARIIQCFGYYRASA